MVTMKTVTKNCAIYTRKSTEEGLDQDFNSLDAQREACEAYIVSQRAEGWKVVNTQYDDGGYSGGNMERPALKALLEDIKAGKIQTIVVYKIDRLTRSLMDFSKLVEIFDEYDVTFVSVTQSFNTTTSMGRLTLNVLLSFAQFEREVTGERIRDKIAASKKKGMWMGGITPLGYEKIDKKLVPHPEQQQTVRYIFEQYLELGSVRQLKELLAQRKYRTTIRINRNGRKTGGQAYSRGHLYQILSNPVYIGKIKHKDKIYDGQHDSIIDDTLFEQVQQRLKAQGPDVTNKTLPSGKLLQGVLYDCDDVIYSPTYTSKKGVRYYYYLSQNLIQYRDHPKGIMARIPAHEIEKTVTDAIKAWLTNAEEWQKAFPGITEEHAYWLTENLLPVRSRFIKTIIKKVIVQSDHLNIDISTKKLREEIENHAELSLGTTVTPTITINTAYKTSRAKRGSVIINSPARSQNDPFDIPTDQLKRIVRGTIWRDEHFAGVPIKQIAQEGGHSENYVNRCIHESFDFLSQ